MKGIIIAQNDWEALLPLTENTSKPMLHFFDRPLISYPIELMKQHGILDICVITEEENEALELYLSQMEGLSILQLPKHGICLKELAQNHEECILFGALTVTDFDLQKLLNYHKSKNNPVTAVYPADIKGIHRLDENGTLLEDCKMSSKEGIFFLQKQAYHVVIRKQKELLHAFLEQNIPVHLFYETGWYSHLSTVGEYLKTSAQMLDHKQFLPEHRSPNGVILKENTLIEIGSKIKPPVYIGANVSIGKNAEILPYSVICRNTVICQSAKVSHSVISDHCQIAAGATVTGAVLGDHVTVEENTVIPAGSIYGRDTRIAPSDEEMGKEYSDRWEMPRFGTLGIQIPLENPNEFLYDLGQVCASLFETGIQGVFKDDSAKSQFFSHSLHAGLQSAGISLYEFPDCTLSMCKSACPFYGLKAGFYLYETKENAAVIILDSQGNPISREMEEAICQAMKQPPHKGRYQLRKITAVKRYQLYYIPEMIRRLESKPAHSTLCCQVSSPMVWEYLQKVANAHKVTLLTEPKDGIIRLECNPSATEFTIFDEANHPLTPRQIESVIAALLIWEKESEFITTLYTPRTLCRYLEQHAVTPREADAHPHNLDRTLKQIPKQYYLCTDPVYLMIKILLYLSEHSLTLSQWVSSLPKSFFIEKTITAGEHLANAVSELLHLAQGKKEIQETTYRFHSKKGVTTVTREDNNFTILSESDREEYAKELTDFYVGQFMKKATKD